MLALDIGIQEEGHEIISKLKCNLSKDGSVLG